MQSLLPTRTTLADHPALRVGPGKRGNSERAGDGDGTGTEATLLVVPGLNDPMCRVTERWWFDAAMGRFMQAYADTHTVYLVSRPPGIREDASVADLAAGYRDVLDETGPAAVMGLSLGGFVALELAARDDRVAGLVMALAAHRLNPHGRRLVRDWRDAAREERWTDVYLGAADVLGTGGRRRAYRAIARAAGAVTRPPRTPRDFEITANAGLAYDGRDTLEAVTAPTLVLGGTADPFFAGRDFATTASRVADGIYREFDGYGHEAVIEHPAFDDEVEAFLAEID